MTDADIVTLYWVRRAGHCTDRTKFGAYCRKIASRTCWAAKKTAEECEK